jgi:hypothetical protein
MGNAMSILLGYAVMDMGLDAIEVSDDNAQPAPIFGQMADRNDLSPVAKGDNRMFIIKCRDPYFWKNGYHVVVKVFATRHEALFDARIRAQMWEQNISDALAREKGDQ